jgi:hypothetical protein
MKKYRKEVIVIAAFALLILPVQQILLKNTAVRTPAAEIRKTIPEEWSSNALSGNAGELMNMVFFHIQQRDYNAAEAWLKFGAMNLQAPSVMLFYGDFLKQKGNLRRAEYFYRFALKKALAAHAPRPFIIELEKRLRKKQ